MTERRIISLPDPKASSLTFRNAARSHFKALTFIHTTDAVVGIRRLKMTITDKSGARKFMQVAFNTTTANTISEWCGEFGLANGMAAVPGFNTLATIPMPPDLVIEEDDTVVINDAASISAGDRITNMVIVVDLIGGGISP